MSARVVRDVINSFLTDSQPGVLVIRGTWGVGKTYFWQACVHEMRGISSRKLYSYVSMFGASSIQRLQLAIAIESVDIKDVRDPAAKGGAHFDSGNLKRWSKQLAATMRDAVPGALGRAVTIGMDALAPHLISNLLICFDDFERLPKTGLQFEEILGLVTKLKEEKNCKIVMIFNDEEMGDRLETYRRYREKVVDVDVLFEPTTQEAADLSIPKDHTYGALIRTKLALLGITNIRLIRKILHNVGLVSPVLAPLGRETAEANVSIVVLLTWLEYEPGGDHPSLEFVEHWQSLAWIIEEERAKKDKKGGEDPEKEKHRRWAALLQRYGVVSFDSCDKALARVVSRGYVDGSGLREEVARLGAEIDAADAEARFTRAWRLYHDSLDDNEAEIVRIADETFDSAAPRLTPGNVDATIRLMRDLGQDPLADSLIDRYLRIRGAETELFDPDEWVGTRDLEDPKFKEACQLQYRKDHAKPTLDEALLEIAKPRGWSNDQISVLENATEDDLYAAFRRAGDHFTSEAEACLRFADDPNRKSVAERATGALRRLARESRLNQRRIMQKFGIAPD